MNLISVPLIIIGFNRPDFLRRQLEFIVENDYVFENFEIYIDGPREDSRDDVSMHAQIIDLFDEYSKFIKFYYVIREKNYGCKRHIKKIISETFNKYDKAVFLEDDCLPVVGFYEYMQNSLTKYEADLSVVHVGGSNLVKQDQRLISYATIFPTYWGWGGWANKTKKYIEISIYVSEIKAALAKSNNFKKMRLLERLYWMLIFKNAICSSTIWDFELTLNVLADDKYSIYPSRNLINNIGFRRDATHMKSNDIPVYVKNNYASSVICADWDFHGLESDQLITKRSSVLFGFGILSYVRLILGSFYRYVVK